MTLFDYRQFYRRNRPHIHPPGATLFVTFRLADSIPQTTVKKYRSERLLRERQVASLMNRSSAESDTDLVDFHRKWFVEFDAILDRAASGPMWLGRPEVRSIVYEKLLEGDTSKYRLDAFSIMSNHVHVVFRPNLDESDLSETRKGGRTTFDAGSANTLAEIMQSLKGTTARECNRLLNRAGQFWEHESFDHVVRDEAGFFKAVRYTLKNPVKAGLVKNPMDWPGNYVAPRLIGRPELGGLLR